MPAALLLVVSGCKTSVNSVENAQKTGQRQMVSDQRAVTDNEPRQESFHRRRQSAMTPGGFLKVQIELLNTTRSPQRFSYHFEWFDANGMQITTLRPPRFPTRFRAAKTSSFPAMAPTPECRDFRVKFIEN